MIHIMAMTKENVLKAPASIEELEGTSWKWYWIDFDQPSQEEILKLRHPLGFHPLAIEDCIHKLQRPKLNDYEDHVFFVFQSLNPDRLQKEELNLFLGEHFAVTFHHLPSKEISEVRDKLKKTDKPGKWGPAIILYEVLDKIVDQYFPYLYKIEDRLNEIEDNSKNESMEDLLTSLYSTRHDLLVLRNTIMPMTDLVYRMLNSHTIPGIQEKRAYFHDIHDHLLKLSGMVESNREFTTDIRDSYLSLNSHQTNRVMKILTIFTTIFMPLTFIAGVYGMNFKYMPELEWKYGYFATLIVMFLIGAGMTYWFFKKGWLK
ncbi:magnesium/cobalt transporter CorA [Weizmannia coagulans]|jgi:magnesium transporter|uniref:Magnesium transport protein CorA n=3 Tax=Heyndrickxia TaxID=2837504 RepID=A0A0C5C900_HEYCO|nr:MULTISPECIES: magnesium/cobalt transporter CorA [Heyndrickxia]AEP01373.1 magnesium and cobalt transport protein CorA [Heyndrickxia coagulans 36D1]AJO21880.1 magnesium and cobalt transport protein CorA [Heyndrickxia coagulans]AKN52501.1 Magnesium and cobalt transport protein CorA [Heyndrickxia coagulans]ATW82340.1 magnesium and cobalt transport protein CorA [Heyndrickxia coagulans]AVD57001.1 magnesium and cobalt transport protein CorA [Heyndrickxia coagulans]